MNILLIKPPTGEIYKRLKGITPEYPPLGLAYIAAVLEENEYTVKIIDLAVEDINKEGLIKFIEEYHPKIIGLTSTTPTINGVFQILTDLKSVFKDIIFVLGGPHPTALPEESLRYADIVVRGEGEYTFLDIVKATEKDKNLDHILGISYKNNGKTAHNPNRPLAETIDTIPFPARHLLRMERYHYFGAKKHPLTNIFTSRGCPFSCVYCNKTIFGKRFRPRSVENVMEEIDLLVSDYGIKEIHISDDTFNLHKKRAIELCIEIKKRNYDLSFFPHNGIRVDSVNTEMLEAMKSAGFYATAFGVESGDPRILDNIKKGITIEKVKTAFRLAKRIGFETWAFFILGLPGETKESAERTINFAIKLNPDIVKFSILVPFPGTDVYNYYKDRLLIKDWAQFGLWAGPTFEPENMTVKELENLFRTSYREFYMRPSPILKLLKRNITHPSLLIENVRAGFAVLNITNR